MSDAGGPRFLPQIESLRGFAALSVAFAHCGIVLLMYDGTIAPNRPNAAAAWLLLPFDYLLNARAAVVVFFVISGLVLAMALDRQPAHRSLVRLGGFLGRRALRLYPAHVAALCLFLPVAALTIFQIPIHDPGGLEGPGPSLEYWAGRSVYGSFDPGAFIASAALLGNYYNPPVWTLQVELIGALCLPFFAALSRPGRLGLDLASVVILFAIGASLDRGLGYSTMFVFLPAFYLGCMVRTHGRRLAALASARSHGPGALVATALLLLVVPEALVGPVYAHQLILLSMAVASFAIVSALAWTSSRAIETVLLNPAARWVGRVSYSFYLWHALVMFAVVRLELAILPGELFGRWDQVLRALTFVVSSGIALAVAGLSYRWIERPFIALGRRTGAPAPPLSATPLEAAR
ncbi:MAG TPA: acyltransferase [Allosphingosinicella sp.]|jgi:peptidoglycan/LPS O-acetylase OafA/YrhL